MVSNPTWSTPCYEPNNTEPALCLLDGSFHPRIVRSARRFALRLASAPFSSVSARVALLEDTQALYRAAVDYVLFDDLVDVL
jgi:hypothetical protein